MDAQERGGENRLEKIECEPDEAGPRISLESTEGRPAQCCVEEIPHGKSLTHPVVYIKEKKSNAEINIVCYEYFDGAEHCPQRLRSTDAGDDHRNRRG